MRIVRYAPQERVDTPDATAMSFLQLGEFRRDVRGLMLGPESGGTFENFILRGFAVEPQAVPDSTIRVRLDPGGGSPLGFAIGAENLGAVIDHGQLIGGKDSAGRTEGNATQTLDFTAEAPATFTVQMRFIYSESVNDNRAFWNETIDNEFIAATDTRFLPIYQLRLSGAPSDEWIDLADVVWDGVSIDAGDITDLRVFAFEGDSATGFQQATQTGTGGMLDFDRGTGRASVGLNEVYPVLRLLGRQIQDLKGPDAAGQYNVFSRVTRPFDNTGSTLPAGQTKSLTSVDATTFTIGDGVTTFGDFNGVTGLETCLQHLEDLTTAGDEVPAYIRIILKSHSNTGFTWNITTSHVIGTPALNDLVTLEIVGRAGGGGAAGKGGGADLTRIDVDSVPSATAINVFGRLILRDLAIGPTAGSEPTNNIGVVQAGVLQAYDCVINGRFNTGSDDPAVRITNGGTGLGPSTLKRCFWQGRLRIGNLFAGAAISVGGSIEDCETANGAIQFDLEAADGGTGATHDWVIRNTLLTMDETHGFGLRGAIDIGEATRISIEDCTLAYVSDVDCIHTRRVNSTPARVHVRNCLIFTISGATHTVAPGTGQNSPNGTGWGVYVDASGGTGSMIDVNHCTFSQETIDAGGIYLEDTEAFFITNNEWKLCGSTAVASSSYTAIKIVDGTAAAGNDISGNTMSQWSGAVDTRTAGITIDNTSNVNVEGNTFNGQDSAFAAITGRGATNVAIELTGTAVLGVRIHGNTFINWEEDTDVNRCIRNTATTLGRPVISLNNFENNGGYCVELTGAGIAHPSVVGNTVNIPGSEGRAFTLASAASPVVNGNNISGLGAASAAPAEQFIDFSSASTAMCMGNRILGPGTIANYIDDDATAVPVWGVNATALNSPTDGNYLT